MASRTTGAWAPQGRGGGFTLLEVVVAVAIFAVIGSILFAGLNQLINVKTTVDQRLTLAADLQRSFGLFRDDLNHYVPRSIRNAYGQTEPGLQTNAGTGSAVLVLTRTNNGLDGAQLERVEYWWEEGRVIRVRWPMLDRATDEQQQRRVLLDQVTAIEVRVLDDEGHWNGSWPPIRTTGDRAQARAVELRVSLDGQGDLVSLVALPYEPAPEEQGGS